MNILLVIAGVLLVLVGLAHSLLGEIMIFNKLRNGTIIPTGKLPPLKEAHLRILWATWHLPSILGFALGLILMHFASMTSQPVTEIHIIAASLTVAGLLVAYATNAKHPGWIGLLLSAALCFLA